MTGFLHACINGHFEVVEMLLKKSTKFKIELNHKTMSNETAFHQAVRSGNLKVIDTILHNSAEIGIDLNEKMNFEIEEQRGWTAFHCACIYGTPKMVEMLIQKSAEYNIDLNARTYSGITALQLAFDRGHIKIAKILKQNLLTNKRKREDL